MGYSNQTMFSLRIFMGELLVFEVTKRFNNFKTTLLKLLNITSPGLVFLNTVTIFAAPALSQTRCHSSQGHTAICKDYLERYTCKVIRSHGSYGFRGLM